MCGSSASQNALEAGQQSFSQLLAGNYAQNYGAQSQAFQTLNNSLTPIAQAGPDQTGWGPQETAAVNTQITQGTGQNYAQASRALNNQQASAGGGNSVLPSGAQASQQAGLASAAANQESAENVAATEANYGQGRQNWQQATAGLQALGNAYNPTGIAGQATQANSSAAGQAQQINQENNQWESDLVGIATGGVGALLGGISGGIGNLDTAGTSTGGEQAGNFASGFLGGLKG